MKAKYVVAIFAIVGLVAIIVAVTVSRSHAGYPMISGIPDQYLDVNSQTGVISFNVYDDMTSPDSLRLSYTSDNPALVPADSAHIILGGSGSDRTVQVIPVPDKGGTATITIIVADTDGETNQDSFEVEVTKMPQT